MIVKPFELDKSKVKRLFVFGCSFTSFIWPTWANIVAKELEAAQFYNLGQTGSGNLAISARISEAHHRFKFTDSDLVMIMWSTFLREDRWLHGRWIGGGNVYNTGMYDENFRKNYTDVCGYLIRDGALINMTQSFLDNLSCQTIMMPSVPFDYIDSYVEYNSEIYEKVLDLYKFLFDNMPKSLYDHVRIGTAWPEVHRYYWENMGGIHTDNHPSPKHALDYLQKNIMNLSYKTQDYAESATEKLLSLDTKEKIGKEFEYDTKGYLLF